MRRIQYTFLIPRLKFCWRPAFPASFPVCKFFRLLRFGQPLPQDFLFLHFHPGLPSTIQKFSLKHPINYKTVSIQGPIIHGSEKTGKAEESVRRFHDSLSSWLNCSGSSVVPFQFSVPFHIGSI